jgi:hypothetical protein
MGAGLYYSDTFNGRCDMKKFEVQEYCLCGGWTNTWSDDDEPTRFESKESAQLELDEFFKEMAEEVEAGNLEDCSGPDDFRIVEVTE